MNLLVLTCLLCFVVCGTFGTQGSGASFSSELAVVTRGPTSGEGLQGSLSTDDELETDEELSGGDTKNVSFHDSSPSRDERKKKKGKGKKRNKQRSKSSTPLNPEHTIFTNGYTSTLSTTEDPCNSTYLGYCIHGYCKYIEGLQEPVCICLKGYNGERCEIQTLEVTKTREDQGSSTQLVQMVLVVIAVVLSVISCTAILLLICAHYRSHKNFLASYLGTGTEQEKLQNPIRDVVV
ncbi:proheparin-binding EGF-like growth factor [Brachionichthys hirsutus]|uniref:proheparin-binding EGF-like growth factor n=1 Tax=Brachionichthys hirsutus TaxID=412623 RepID=UPI003604F223